MEKKNGLTKFLAIAGTVLVWFPLLAPVVLAFTSLIANGKFLLDYLMPAELFPSVLVGGILLIWAAIRAHTRRKLIGWSLASALVLLYGTQGLAVVTGLASGENAATGWRIAVVFGGLMLFLLAVISTGVGGVLLIRDLYKAPEPAV
jgi:hypothetical protein